MKGCLKAKLNTSFGAYSFLPLYRRGRAPAPGEAVNQGVCCCRAQRAGRSLAAALAQDLFHVTQVFSDDSYAE